MLILYHNNIFQLQPLSLGYWLFHSLPMPSRSNSGKLHCQWGIFFKKSRLCFTILPKLRDGTFEVFCPKVKHTKYCYLSRILEKANIPNRRCIISNVYIFCQFIIKITFLNIYLKLYNFLILFILLVTFSIVLYM